MASIKVKSLPEADVLLVEDDDVLILETATETCQITVKDLRTIMLKEYDTIQEVIQDIKNDYDIRLKAVEMIYPFRINDITLPKSNASATWISSVEFNSNQGIVECDLNKQDMITYNLHLKELNVTTEYSLNGDKQRWIALKVDFNIDGNFVALGNKNSGVFAGSYNSLDNTNNVYNFSAKNDILYIDASAGSNSILLWVRITDEIQTFSFVDSAGNELFLNVTTETIPIPSVLPNTSTYTVYKPDDVYPLSTNITVANTMLGKTFEIEYVDDIPYTLDDGTIPQSGNWVRMHIEPLATYQYPTSLVINGDTIPIVDLVDVMNGTDKLPIGTDYQYTYDSSLPSAGVDLLIRFVPTITKYSCVFTWGSEYVDTVNVSYNNNLLFPNPTI